MLTTPSILLRSHDVGEAHRIYTFYTRDHGKVEALATGVRKTTSKLAGHLTSESIIVCTFHMGSERPRLVSATRERDFPMLRGDLTRYRAVHVAREALDVLTRPGITDARLYALLARLYELLEAENTDPRLLVRVYLHRILDVLGVLPMPKTIERQASIVTLLQDHVRAPLTSMLP